ncbi:hypothetical protein ZYGR_0N02070 [Zygosaccharomyces rouxii]|uniref:Phosphodiesterase n=2 Tax=Zygosaccharomyces rouxii TaxID=4956 RepID=C5DVA2_ZYGRC|nr:uncharacterized protein ZYRO0D05082g [Zygosaccharomyces rouxii]KAH9200634.1 hypothetical protein LQ764DRAFT_97254 [Zygosaccharomyces rouxii]GAV48802.1 hypothetical protein ZYGR_0N02070 [Zygosaccharomyces rouxii]CAR27721.1 ZYRO0D05082p [Zygosaccharomyces rouxii]
MSSLFLVGGVAQGPLQDAIDTRFPSLFDRVVVLDDINQLLLYLYRERVGAKYIASASDSNTIKPWSFETGIALIVHRPDGTYKDLNPILQRFFPCLNAIALTESQLRDDDSTLSILSRLQQLALICRDRIARMSHWMYDDGPFSGLYLMIRHLRCVQQFNQQVNVIPRAIRSIDFASLLGVTPEMESRLWDSLDTWSFQPHSLQTKELVYCGFLLLRQCARDAKSTVQENKLLLLIFTLESSYHQVNRFHNFRHAVDVMQAAWQLAKRLLTDPLQVLLVTLAALGHDVGHPGANNQLLCKYNSPVALHYKQRSVLENLHTDIFTSLLSEHWPQLIGKTSQGRQHMELISEAIMATDMAFHGNYVRQLQESNQAARDPRSLLSLILKAADISNVTRPLTISAQWAALITLEFDDCALLDRYQAKGGKHNSSTSGSRRNSYAEGRNSPELEHGIDYSDDFYTASPEQLTENFPAIPAGQIFFIDTFAEQFFAEFCKTFPQVGFLVENVKSNREFWVSRS